MISSRIKKPSLNPSIFLFHLYRRFFLWIPCMKVCAPSLLLPPCLNIYFSFGEKQEGVGVHTVWVGHVWVELKSEPEFSDRHQKGSKPTNLKDLGWAWVNISSNGFHQNFVYNQIEYMIKIYHLQSWHQTQLVLTSYTCSIVHYRQ